MYSRLFPSTMMEGYCRLAGKGEIKGSGVGTSDPFLPRRGTKKSLLRTRSSSTYGLSGKRMAGGVFPKWKGVHRGIRGVLYYSRLSKFPVKKASP